MSKISKTKVKIVLNLFHISNHQNTSQAWSTLKNLGENCGHVTIPTPDDDSCFGADPPCSGMAFDSSVRPFVGKIFGSKVMPVCSEPPLNFLYHHDHQKLHDYH